MWSLGTQAELDDTFKVQKVSETIQDTCYKKKETDQVVEMKETDPRYEYRDSPELTYLVMKFVYY